MPPLILYRWNGEAMEPLPRFARTCDEEFVIGEVYRMEAHEERSERTHRHQFAWLHEAWLNLPERYQMEPWAQTSEHLRKYALIRAGWHDSQTFLCGSKAEAQRWAANLRPLDAYSVVVVQDSSVVRLTAKSQSRKAMGARDFQKSKEDVLNFVASLLGVAPETLERSAA